MHYTPTHWGDGAIPRDLIRAPDRGTSRSRSIVQMKGMDHTLHMLCSDFANIEVDRFRDKFRHFRAKRSIDCFQPFRHTQPPKTSC